MSRLIYYFTRRRLGKVAASVRVTGNNPTVLLGYGLMEQYLGKSHRVAARLKSLASLRAATRVGCPF